MSDSSWGTGGSSSEQRDNNPFSDSFSFEHFYTGAADSHHHSTRVTVRVPENWPRFASMVALNPKIPQYETASDIFRDGIAKAIRAALDVIGDPNMTAEWNVQLAIAEQEAQNARDAAEVQLVELWQRRLSQPHGWTPEAFAADYDGMQNPQAQMQMEAFARMYQIAL